MLEYTYVIDLWYPITRLVVRRSEFRNSTFSHSHVTLTGSAINVKNRVFPHILTGAYKVPNSPPPGGGELNQRVSETGEGNQRERKKEGEKGKI